MDHSRVRIEVTCETVTMDSTTVILWTRIENLLDATLALRLSRIQIVITDNLSIEVCPCFKPIHSFQIKVDDGDRTGRINRQVLRSTKPKYYGTVLERRRKQVCHEVSVEFFRVEPGMVRWTINRMVGCSEVLQLFKRRAVLGAS